jgi:hypothetical protein
MRTPMCLLAPSRYLWFNHREINIVVGLRLPAGMGAKQDDGRPRRGGTEPVSRFSTRPSHLFLFHFAASSC